MKVLMIKEMNHVSDPHEMKSSLENALVLLYNANACLNHWRQKPFLRVRGCGGGGDGDGYGDDDGDDNKDLYKKNPKQPSGFTSYIQ